VTGNDIVDITTAAADSNWKRKGFLEKIFTQKEQAYIHNAAAPAQMVWKLWSMKESAYKIYTRQYGGRFFAPQKLSCTILHETAGQVVINNISYQTITSSAKDYIYSIARPEAYGNINFYNCCFTVPQQDYTGQQKFIYEKLVAHYACIQRADKNNFIVLKEKGNIPFLYCKKEKIEIPVSITHHGNYAAFTIH
jgi:phosphopantetheinyl transferase (holo-ACP synthase)